MRYTITFPVSDMLVELIFLPGDERFAAIAAARYTPISDHNPTTINAVRRDSIVIKQEEI
jgi:hypothetical protein